MLFEKDNREKMLKCLFSKEQMITEQEPGEQGKNQTFDIM